ncbi:DNA repair metallo-beta-lactamase [Lasallia pustulata]|uniref:Protein artemis n=1 Tax=Lasallia pustulata TaxID=136370 RepID=A0A1W5CRY6_9LECA|nr:DNA repair metallo-beta-lactamase [Lasallia pustulata]
MSSRKTIPLDTPTEIELGPSKSIRVTLLDANHCAGAVMFLIEGDAKAVLYTGDIRSEPWWVNSLTRNPLVLPYTIGSKRLNKIYLDTTFAVNRNPYREFPSKASGLRELLDKVSRYPADTVFHFHAWTFGYEEIWIMLAAALNSQIHVDRYKMGLYKSLTKIPRDGAPAPEGSALCGFKCGNRVQPGCLTSDEKARLHSCEHGTSCIGIESSADVVWIKPIITRTERGADLPELGAGGGGGDLTQMHELELDDTVAAMELMKLCSEKIEDSEARSKTLRLITQTLKSRNKAMSLDALGWRDSEDAIRLDELTRILAEIAERKEGDLVIDQSHPTSLRGAQLHSTIQVDSEQSPLPRIVTFPYSRHSSYDELCRVVEAFKPLDVYPCTTDEETWHPGLSMEALFGHFCSGKIFVHDQGMMALEDSRAASRARKRTAEEAELMADGATASQRTVGSEGFSDPDETLVDTDSHAVHRQLLDGLPEGIDQVVKRQRVFPPLSNEQSSMSPLGSSSNILHERKVTAIKDLVEPCEAQIEVAELFHNASHISDNKIPDDIVMDDIPGHKLREEAAAVAEEYSCSNIMARAIVGARRRRPSRSLYTEHVADAKTRDGGKSLEAEVSKSEDIRLKMNRLRKLMPVADEALCYDALTLERGSYIKARDLLAVWVEQRLVDENYSDCSDEEGGEGGRALQQPNQDSSNDDGEAPDTPLSDEGAGVSAELDVEHAETQISLADSEFDSQEHSVPNEADGQAKGSLERDKIRSRKEAYKAAQGLHYRWAEFSPMSSGNTHTEEELEL